MQKELRVSQDEKEFYIKNCPLTINKKSFKKGYINTLAKEKGSGRNILFYISKEKTFIPKEIGDLLILASAYDVDIVVYFGLEIHTACTQAFKWLQKISKENVSFLLIKTKNLI